MNKAEIVNRISERVGLTKVKASAAVETFMESILMTLKSGKRVTLVGFGTFSVTKRSARKGRNPATGESIRIKAKKVAKFKPSNDLNTKL